MAQIEHVMPQTIRPLSGAVEGMKRPGLQVTKYQTGYRSSRDWFEYSMRYYKWTMNRFSADSEVQEIWEAFLDQVAVGGEVCWIREALVSNHPRVPLSRRGDGSQTTFVLPMYTTGPSPSPLNVMVAGVPTSDYSIHASCNALTDDQANAVDGTTGTQATGTCVISQATFPVADGRTSFLINPTGTVSNYGIEVPSTSAVAASVGDEHSFFAAVWGTGAVELHGVWYNLGGSEISHETDSDTMVYGGWTLLHCTGTAPSNTVGCGPKVICTDSSDANFWVACMGVLPGDLDQWFLPSEAPMAIDFDTAPADRARIVANANWTWMARVRLMVGGMVTWNREKPGATEKVKITLEEELES